MGSESSDDYDSDTFGETESSEEEGEEDNETQIRPRQGNDHQKASMRQRDRASKTKTQSPLNANHTTTSTPAAVQRELSSTRNGWSFLWDVSGDMWTWLKSVFKFSKASYPLWKWVAMLYLSLLGLSYLLAYMYRFVGSTLAPLCSVRILESKLPICAWFPDNELEKTLDVSKLTASQEGLIVVMDRVGENYDLARDMVGHEFAIQDLNTRVAASNLSLKEDLAQELYSLSRRTKKTAKDLSHFTVKVSGSISRVHRFDESAAKHLQMISSSANHPQTLLGQVLSALNPISAFTPSTASKLESQIKDLFIYTANGISSKVQLLIDDSFELDHNLDAIKQNLDRIREITLEELGHLPHAQLLSAVWTYLARHDDYLLQKSHTALLGDMQGFYNRSSDIMQDTIAALNRIEAELTEFREDYATPGLVLRDYPLEVVVALLRDSGQRLLAGKQRLEFIEEKPRSRRSESCAWDDGRGRLG